MVAEWPTDELWHAPSASRRLTAVAGSIVQVSFGIALLALSALFGENRAQVVREAMCALLHICAIGNLLPVPRTDGHILFGRTPSVGPMWIAFASAVLLALPVPLLVTAIQFEHGFVRAYLASLQNGAALVPLVLALLALLAVSRRWLPRA